MHGSTALLTAHARRGQVRQRLSSLARQASSHFLQQRLAPPLAHTSTGGCLVMATGYGLLYCSPGLFNGLVVLLQQGLNIDLLQQHHARNNQGRVRKQGSQSRSKQTSGRLQPCGCLLVRWAAAAAAAAAAADGDDGDACMMMLMSRRACIP
eukprot:1078064-Pelagomonas_calceolata.AAC.3